MQPPVAAAATRPVRGPLVRLGLVGMASIEAPVIAALATETPLLLIGPHGTAKSLLLCRIAAALGLEFRHYNASLLNFDDLVGFPLPGPDGELRYARTPTAIWGAGAVVFDEISRCRPDIQNKLFPIVHERRVQGLLLDGLQHRWAAMNPPPTDADANGYDGSEPLDAALADRFGFVVEMPSWQSLSAQQQLAIIQADGDEPTAEAKAALCDLVRRSRARLATESPDVALAVADYVHALLPLLAEAGLPVSPRRANLLWRTARAVLAAQQELDPLVPRSEALLCALCSALPHRAQGIPVPHAKLLAAHREAQRAVALEDDDPLRAVLATKDPLARLQLALRALTIPDVEFSDIVTDALATLAPGAYEAAVAHLFDTGAAGRLHAALASDLSKVWARMAVTPSITDTLYASEPRHITWKRLQERLATLDPEEPGDRLHANAIALLYHDRLLQTPSEVESAFRAFASTRKLLEAA